jgi:hypothetical protein
MKLTEKIFEINNIITKREKNSADFLGFGLFHRRMSYLYIYL